MFANLWYKLRGVVSDAFGLTPGQRASGKLTMDDVDNALIALEQHGLRVNYYFPPSFPEHRDLAAACRVLGNVKYILTDLDGNIIGQLSKAETSKNKDVAARRESFKIVKSD